MVRKYCLGKSRAKVTDQSNIARNSGTMRCLDVGPRIESKVILPRPSAPWLPGSMETTELHQSLSGQAGCIDTELFSVFRLP